MTANPESSADGSGTELSGTVERITFYNPENGFSVVKLRIRGRREPAAVVGTLPAVQPGEVLALRGAWQTDPRHGARFVPQSAEVRPPSDLDSVSRYLGSGLIRQIGPVLAERIVATFGAQTLEVLDADPERVRQVPGIGRQRGAAIAAAWIEHRALRAVTAFLSEHGLDTRFAARLVRVYGAEAPKVLRANPYRLVAEVPGLGFAAADRLGRALGVRPTAPARLQAAVQAALLRAAEQGHTRVAVGAAGAGGWELGIGDEIDASLVNAAVQQLLASGVLSHGAAAASSPLPEADSGPLFASPPSGPLPNPTVSKGRLRIFEPPPAASSPDRPPPSPHPVETSQQPTGNTQQPTAPPPTPTLGLARLVRAEQELASRLRVLASRGGLPAARVEGWLAADAEAWALSPEQLAAVRTAATSGCFVLTGGPGVGKTTTLRVLVHCLQALGRSVALAAPTGKAARRLGEVTGLEARTIHRLLGAGPRGFRHGPAEPLAEQTVVVDEASMLDTQLASALVRAVGSGGQLILVGDADQLPSVGPGQVLRDLLASEALPAARLERVFRQAAQSRIVTNAHLIRQGLPPPLAPPTALAEGVDCVFVPASPARIAEIAARWATDELPRTLGLDPGEVQTLAPLNRVCQTLNSLLQARLNPPRGQAERPHGALPLRLGDRVIQTRNNYQLEVFNGESGKLVDLQPQELTVELDDGRQVVYTPADLLDLEHAYCLTVHRAQGSEWPGVIVLVSSSYGPMLSRNLLYTALTRARRAAILIGDEAAISRAVADTRDLERSTGLRALLATAGERESA